MKKSSRPHDDAIVEMLREDPAFAEEYLAVATDEANQNGGRQAMLAALRHVARAQGVPLLAQRAALRRKSGP